MYQSPPLYKTSSTGAELAWNIYTRPIMPDGVSAAILQADQPWEIVTIHGQLGGKAQTTVVKITSGKNIGRANETSIEEQADSEAESKFKHQLDKSYSTDRGGASKEYKPMLAHSYDDHKKKVTFPCYIQPKLDGMRCIAIREGNTITLMSRGNKEIKYMDHIKAELIQFMDDGDVWDGELYRHDITFQDIMKCVKKECIENKLVQYHVYDAISTETFRERFLNDKMMNLGLMAYQYVHHVMTYSCKSEANITEWHNKFVESGYEGAILRNGDCLYKEGSRSNQLLKVKAFDDAEFLVVDIVPGDKSPTHGKFICLMTGTNTTFTATPDGPFELKEAYLRGKNKFIGKMVNVRYFGLTTSDIPIPRFPIMKYLRSEE